MTTQSLSLQPQFSNGGHCPPIFMLEMYEITYTFVGKTCYMYYKGPENKAEAHFNKQIRECGFKGAKLVSVMPLVAESYEIPVTIITPEPLKPKRKPRKRRPAGNTKRPAASNARAQHSAADTSKPKTNRKTEGAGSKKRTTTKKTEPGTSVRRRSNPRNST